MRVAVVDGQGGGIGKIVIERLRKNFGDRIEIIALGTNALATSQMLKAGADVGASGENAIVFTSSKVDVIIGTIGIIAANSMLGEITPSMAKAISESKALKLLIPFQKCNIKIMGVMDKTMNNFIDEIMEYLKEMIE
ncbi:MAG TPA: DUF3842 family protein [Thermotogaceae bacterium]|nr:DUF3842 family protein [Thermotogaceae bacterium]